MNEKYFYLMFSFGIQIIKLEMICIVYSVNFKVVSDAILQYGT